jgi:hypothetical protein
VKKAQYFSGMMNVNRLLLSSPGRQHNNADALSRRPCKVCLRHQDRNTEEESETECATTLEQVRVTTGSKQSHSVEPKILKKNWKPEEIRESQLNDNKLNSYTTVYQIKKEKLNWNQVSPIKIEGQTSQWAKTNGQTSIDKRINRKTKDRVTQI